MEIKLCIQIYLYPQLKCQRKHPPLKDLEPIEFSPVPPGILQKNLFFIQLPKRVNNQNEIIKAMQQFSPPT